MNRLGAWLLVWSFTGAMCVGACSRVESDSPSSELNQPTTSQTPGTSASTTTVNRRPSFDPPKYFGGDGVYVGTDNAVIGRETVYSIIRSDAFDGPSEIQAVGLGSGKVRWRQSLGAGGRLTDLPSSVLAIAVHADGKESVSTPVSGSLRGLERSKIDGKS
jgi:hypothetical protein